MKAWYAVHCHPRAEAKAAAHLRRQGFGAYYPQFLRRRSHARKVDWVPAPLFPRYIFVQVDIETVRWRAIHSTVGVASLVCSGDRPQTVPDEIVTELQACENEKGYVELYNRQRMTVGDNVRILYGSFADQIGRLESLDDQGRVTLLLQFMGQSVRMKASLKHLAATG